MFNDTVSFVLFKCYVGCWPADVAIFNCIKYAEPFQPSCFRKASVSQSLITEKINDESNRKSEILRGPDMLWKKRWGTDWWNGDRCELGIKFKQNAN